MFCCFGKKKPKRQTQNSKPNLRRATSGNLSSKNALEFARTRPPPESNLSGFSMIEKRQENWFSEDSLDTSLLKILQDLGVKKPEEDIEQFYTAKQGENLETKSSKNPKDHSEEFWSLF